MAMSRQEMLEKLEILVKESRRMDDAVRDYERGGRRDDLETIENAGRICTSVAKDLQDWHA